MLDREVFNKKKVKKSWRDNEGNIKINIKIKIKIRMKMKETWEIVLKYERRGTRGIVLLYFNISKAVWLKISHGKFSIRSSPKNQ